MRLFQTHSTALTSAGSAPLREIFFSLFHALCAGVYPELCRRVANLNNISLTAESLFPIIFNNSTNTSHAWRNTCHQQ